MPEMLLEAIHIFSVMPAETLMVRDSADASFI
jgi:hypothetical protein